jgi:hypothetical protein
MLPLAAAAGQQPLLPHLLAAADWGRLAATISAEEEACSVPGSWLLLPLLLAPASVAGSVGSRVVHAACLLSRGAVLAGSPQAAAAAAGAIGPLLLRSLCQGAAHRQQDAQQQPAHGAALVTGQPEQQLQQQQQQQQQMVIPEGFPLELLADTVEGQQLDAAAAAALAASDTEGQQQQQVGAQQPRQQEQQGQQQEQALLLVEVRASWSLTADQHVQLVQSALLPLAASQASLAAAASLQPDDCPANLATAGQPGSSPALIEWRAPPLADLLQISILAASDARPVSAGVTAPAATAAGVGALLLPLACLPATVLTSDSLAFANSELPLDTQSALFISSEDEGRPGSSGAAGSGAQQRPLRTLQQTLTALLPGAEARRRAEQAQQAAGSADAGVIKLQLLLAIQARSGCVPCCRTIAASGHTRERGALALPAHRTAHWLFPA